LNKVPDFLNGCIRSVLRPCCRLSYSLADGTIYFGNGFFFLTFRDDEIGQDITFRVTQ